MKITEIKENEDGSATMQVELTQEEVGMLIEYAISKIFTEQFEIEQGDTYAE